MVDSILFVNQDKGIQYRFTISEFRDKNYIGIREWYMDFDGDYAPSNNGVTMPYTLNTTSRLYAALHKILSDAESLYEITKVPDLGLELENLGADYDSIMKGKVVEMTRELRHDGSEIYKLEIQVK